MQEVCEATEDNPFIHGMSKSFVKALQQLFEVMDVEQTGNIKFSDFISQWDDDCADPFFPKGLIPCLAKVQLPNGLLTFDRFCAGIKLCLLKNQFNINDVHFDETLLDSPKLQNNNSNIQFNNSDTNSSSSMMMTMMNNTGERPSSEPKIFAPPPPQSISNVGGPHQNLASSTEVNNNTIYKMTGQYMGPPVSPTLTSFSSNTAPTIPMTEDSVVLQTMNLMKSNQPKKLPLPSYEQVMAVKSKSLSRLSVNGRGVSNPQPQKSQPLLFSNSFVDEEPRLLHSKLSPSIENGTRAFNNIPENQPMSAMLLPNNNCAKFFPLQPPPKPYKQPSHAPAFNSEQHQTFRTKSMPENLNHMSLSSSAITHQQVIDVKESSSNNHLSVNDTKQSASHQFIDSSKALPNTTTQQNYLKLPPPPPKTVPRNSILKTLQNWRHTILNNTNKQNCDTNGEDLTITENSTEASEKRSNPTMTMMANNSHSIINEQNLPSKNFFRKNPPKRREPRRHTVGANGIDFYSVRRFQQLEQEKEIFFHGLKEIELTKDWYLRQISSTQDKINFIDRSGTFPSDCNIDAYQERLNFQATRIQTVNQHLLALREAGLTYPIHMNLAIHPLNGMLLRVDPNQPKQLVTNPNLVNKLKEQNKLLTDEVTRKSDRITQLEREKSSLIRELFQARTYSSYYNGQFDDTLM